MGQGIRRSLGLYLQKERDGEGMEERKMSHSSGWGRSPGEQIGYPLQYSWASMVAQMVKNPPAMRETGVRSLDWEDPLEESMATHCSILAWRIPMNKGAGQAIVHGITKSQT